MTIVLNGTTGITTPATDNISGNLTFSSTAQRITGDFSNATLASRVYAQSSTTNGTTSFGVIPNGAGESSAYNVLANSNPTNTSFAQLRVGTDTGDVRLTSGISGTGTYLPMTFYTGGSLRLTIDTSGNVGIGTSSPTSQLNVVNAANSGTTTDNCGIVLSSTNRTGYLQLNSVNGVNGNSSVIFSAAGTEQGRILYKADSNYMSFSTATTEKMRIDSSGNVGIGTSSPSASAILDAQSTTKGVRMPNMTTTQKNAIASPAAGLMVFDTTLSKLAVYSGTAWQTITSV